MTMSQQHKNKSPSKRKVRFKHQSKSKSKTKPKTQPVSQPRSFNRKYYKKRKPAHFNENYRNSSYPEYDEYDEKDEEKEKQKTRTFSFKRGKKHSKLIRKEDRSLSTWSKMEIAEWLQYNWYIDNSAKKNSKLLLYINKIKRDKKFDGKNISTLNNRCLKILAQRHLGLKKGESDYKTFKNLILYLQSKYSTKSNLNHNYKPKFQRAHTFTQTNFKSYKYRYHKQYKKSLKHVLRIHDHDADGDDPRPKTPKTRCGIKTSSRKSKKSKTSNRYKEKLFSVNKLDFSTTSPAVSDNGDNGGVTADELLTLISYGHCDEIDTDYDTDHNYNDYKDYIIESPVPVSLKDNYNYDNDNYNVEYDFASLYLSTNPSTNNSNISTQSNSNISSIPEEANNNNNNNNNKTMVIPSIFAMVSEDKENSKNMDICLSPIITRTPKNVDNPTGSTFNLMCYAMTDEETDDDDQENYKYNKNIKNMINDINSNINSSYPQIENSQTSKTSWLVL